MYRQCVVCGRRFLPNRRSHKYCRALCRYRELKRRERGRRRAGIQPVPRERRAGEANP